VDRKGAKRPIFEGETPPKKMYPQYWRRYRRHNRNPVKIAQLFNSTTQMIRVEAGSSIPCLGFHWDLSSSLKSVISEAGFYNIIPNIHFYSDKWALFHYFAFCIDGFLLS
jgi:hypothetical protein